MLITKNDDIDALRADGLVILGENAEVELGVDLCHPTRRGEQRPVALGDGVLIRSGSVIYSGVTLGAGSQTGHHVVVREDTTVGESSVLGTGVKVENAATIGSHVLVETQSHITGAITIEDYVFLGVGVITTNDLRMLHRREGAGARLEPPVLRWGCRIGSGAIIMAGIEVGREAVVSAGAVVMRDVPPLTLVAGNPARLFGEAPQDPIVTQ